MTTFNPFHMYQPDGFAYCEECGHHYYSHHGGLNPLCFLCLVQSIENAPKILPERRIKN